MERAASVTSAERAKNNKSVLYLLDPVLNKGTAFTAEERNKLGLRGLLPPRPISETDQLDRVYGRFSSLHTPLEKYVYLQGLADRNETLFYKLVLEHLEEMMPILYTPTVGEACMKHGKIFSRPRGLYISSEDAGHVDEILGNWPEDDVRVIVVTDGERILGLGDQGAHGMPIPIGKLMLYSLCAGVHPRQCLPVQIDVGTENEGFLADDRYLGLKQRRVRGEAYDALIDEFMTAVQKRFPRCLVQFEDFDNRNAFRLLHHYRERVLCFNDDIQGTAAVTLAAVYSAIRVTKGKLADQTFLFLGAGEAGVGIADLICSALVDEGLSLEEARRKCFFVDSRGLVCKSRTDLQHHKVPFAHDVPFVKTLLEAVHAFKPTFLVGVAGTARQFTQPIVEAMCEHNERPVIFALSNPTSHAECTATEAYTWSKGKAIFATGSPFDPVEYEGRTIVTGQANNSWIFPAVGLGVVASGAKTVPDHLFLQSARTLAAEVSEADLATGCLFPPMKQIRPVSAKIAAAIATRAWDLGLTSDPRPADIDAHIKACMYVPEYVSYA